MKNVTFLISLLVAVIFNSLTAQNIKIKGESIEDWETGTMTQFDWQTGGMANWFITDQNPYEGIYCAQSGDIDDNQQSWISLQYDVYFQDTLSFWLKVSSEANYDYLRFYIDNTEFDSWSGEIGWQKVSFVVPEGTHIFKWEYDKDYSVSSGADAAWIDYIVFPPMEIAAGFTASTTQSCINETVDFTDLSVGPITTWNWTFEGGQPPTSTLQNPTVMYANVGMFDVELIVSDGVEADTLIMNDYIEVNEVPAAPPTPMGLTQLCMNPFNTTYNTMGSPGATDYIWLLLPDEAGVLTGNGTSAVVDWSDTFLGDATIRVAGMNYCGEGEFSMELTVTVYEAPNVTPLDSCLSFLTSLLPSAKALVAAIVNSL
jgi:PKD repeat protein